MTLIAYLAALADVHASSAEGLTHIDLACSLRRATTVTAR